MYSGTRRNFTLNCGVAGLACASLILQQGLPLRKGTMTMSMSRNHDSMSRAMSSGDFGRENRAEGCII